MFNKKKLITSVVLIVITLVIFVFVIPLPEKMLCLEPVKVPSECNVSQAKLPLYISVTDKNNGFAISYVHSVNKGLVTDFYGITRENFLIIKASRFYSYGAGMPEPEDQPGQIFVQTDEYLEMQNINRQIPYLLMAVGVIANHKVYIPERDKTFDLKEWFVPQTRLKISYKSLSLFKYILNTKRKVLNG
jgi:hypothetical protein